MNHASFRLCLFACVLGTFLEPRITFAYLGSFEEQDGYRIPLNGQITSLFLAGDAQFFLNNVDANGFTGVVPPGAYPNTLGDGTHGPDLSRYNAGQYGTTNGGPGGTAADITDNSGLWRALAGGRLNEDATAPYYFGSDLIRDQVVAYRHTTARTGSQSLSLFAAEADLSYAYSLDSRDFNGTAPLSTDAMSIQMSFWMKPTDWDDPDTSSILALSLRDAADQSILEIGYTGDNLLQYRLPGAGAWQTTAHQLGSQGWSEISLILDTAADTASLAVRAFDDSSSTLGSSNGVLNSQSLGVDAGALTGLQWDLHGGALNNGAVSHIHYFDDFSFALSPVPEPGSLSLVGLSIIVLLLPRRPLG